MNDEMEQVIVVPRTDPVYSVFVWRQDSITLTRLRPVLNQLRDVPDQPCRLYAYSDCITNAPGLDRCIPCQIRAIKSALFGDPATNHKEQNP